MKYFASIICCILLMSCVVHEEAKAVFSKTKVEQRNTLDNAPLPIGESFFVIVFNEADSARLNEPITKILQIDTTEDDVGIYECLAKNYVVAKLRRSEFDRLMLDSLLCKVDSASRADYQNKRLPGSFVFITDPREIRIYGQHDLDSRKEEIHDLISVGFGP